MRRVAKASVALTTIFALLACASPRVLTVQEEQQLGNQARAQVKQEFQLLRDRTTVVYLRQFGQELVEAAGPSPFKPTFDIVEDEALNAFAVPGGGIYVTTGTILAVDTLDELAGVIGHEIGHTTSRHSAKAFPISQRTNFFARLLGFIISAATGRRVQRNVGAVLTGIGSTAYFYSHTREAEREADVLAIETIYKAGYDPDGLLTFFERIQKESGGRGIPRFLQSHPLPAERIQAISKLIEERGEPDKRIEPNNDKLKLIQARIRRVTGLDEGLDDDLDEGDQ